MIKKNKTYEIYISDLSEEGLGIGRINDFVVFVPGMLTGERGTVRIVKVLKNYGFGKLEELTERSVYRKEPVCPVFDKCGGCSLLNMNYEGQLKLKKKRVYDCLKRIGGIEADVKDVIASPDSLRYRNKMAFPVQASGSGVRIGCYRQGSHDIVNTDVCYLQTIKAQECISVFRKWIDRNNISIYDEHSRKGSLRHIIVRENMRGELMCALVTASRLKHTEELCEDLKKAGAVSVIENINRVPGNVILGNESRVLSGSRTLKENILGLSYDISLHSFLQVNHKATELLYKTAIDFADIQKNETVVDLYCGAGTISLYAAAKAKEVYGIEIVPQAIQNAKINAKNNGVDNAFFICADCDGGFEQVHRFTDKIDVIILDPPRKGITENVISSITSSGAQRIVYISCDPATLSRDLALICKKGYSLIKVQPVDMFPQTNHIETICCLYHQKKDFISVPYEPKNAD
ncbi:MAG: 23S rRNA (uracil(1939)-C(5))-methyltransferase RlmD [Clostridia bacterium]|nr:23S rRNA (uracil(1939)-C(5))-methyltransferase RlmD [Clostridia bacterium]